jgi:hypothetical protein
LTPELARWWQSVEKEIRDNHQMFNVYGRRWLLLERLTPEALESIIAYKPQSTVGDKVCRVIYLSEDDSRWPSDARIALNNHDSLIAIAPHEKLKTCLSIMKKHAQEPLIINNRPLIIPADCKLSYENDNGYHSWGSLKSVDIEAAA